MPEENAEQNKVECPNCGELVDQDDIECENCGEILLDFQKEIESEEEEQEEDISEDITSDVPGDISEGITEDVSPQPQPSPRSINQTESKQNSDSDLQTGLGSLGDMIESKVLTTVREREEKLRESMKRSVRERERHLREKMQNKMDNIREKYEKEREELMGKLEDERDKREELREKLEDEKEDLRKKINEKTENIEALKETHSNEKEEIKNKLNSEKEELRAKLEKENREMRDRLEEEKSQLEDKIDGLRDEIKEINREMEEKREELRNKFENEKEELKKRLEAEKEELKQRLENEKAEMKERLQNENLETKERLRNEIERTRQDLSEEKNKMRERLESEIENLEESLEEERKKKGGAGGFMGPQAGEMTMGMTGGGFRKIMEEKLKKAIYPFPAIVGQERMKRGLLLNAINPRINGVLLWGLPGDGKRTAMIGLAELLSEIEELGADEEIKVWDDIERYVTGSIKTSSTSANYAIDTVLKSGGLSIKTKNEKKQSPIVLVQNISNYDKEMLNYLDSFDLHVKVDPMEDIERRMEITRRIKEYQKDPQSFHDMYQSEMEGLRDRIIQTRQILPAVVVGSRQRSTISNLCTSNKLTAGTDIIIEEIARTITAYDGREEVLDEDIQEAVDIALIHRIEEDITEEI